MKSLQKLLKKNNILIALITAAFLMSCGEEKPKANYIARVNNSYLSEKEFEKLANSSTLKGKFREEIIRQWIEKEMLFQQAISEDITDDPQYKMIIENSRKELAASFLLKKIVDDTSIKFESEDLEKYYQKYNSHFTARQKIFLINKIEFENEEQAIQFRTAAVESDWSKSLNAFSSDSVFLSSSSDVLLTESDFFSAAAARIANGLLANEISIVFKNQNQHYEIIQLIQKFESGDLLPFQVVRKDVETAFIEDKSKDVIDAYLKDLYSKYKIEIKNGN